MLFPFPIEVALTVIFFALALANTRPATPPPQIMIVQPAQPPAQPSSPSGEFVAGLIIFVLLVLLVVAQ